MGNSNSGRRVINEEDRKFCVGISMSNSVYQLVDDGLRIGTFSNKVEVALREWATLKSRLVRYDTEEQRSRGEPVILNSYAELVYACSGNRSGYMLDNSRYKTRVHDVGKQINPTGGGLRQGQSWVEDYLVPALRRSGLIVQVVNETEYDLFEVWVSVSMTGDAGKDCGSCPVVNEIIRYCKEIQEGGNR